MSEIMLEANNVSKAFGGVKANQDISLSVSRGQIAGMIGPNGSGKSTFFGSVCGYHPIDTGTIKYRGQEISGMRVADIARLGLLRTFQQTRIYGEMDCVKNMVISRPIRDGNLRPLFSRPTNDVLTQPMKSLVLRCL